jgi:hypothetical protein
VGPTPGTSGQQRACVAHGLNNGQSKANGVQCTPASITISWEPGECTAGPYIDVNGAGLQPNSGLSAHETVGSGTPSDVVGDASSSGTYSGPFFVGAIDPGSAVWVTGTAAGGSSVTSNTLTCT